MRMIVGFLVIFLLIAGCTTETQQKQVPLIEEAPAAIEEETEQSSEEEAVPGVPECTKCTVKELTITTSDGDTLPMVPGKGSYTGAGAIEWAVEKGAPQCEEEVKVPIKIIKRSYGKIVSEDSLSLVEGETSKIIDHPTIKTLKFTLRVDDLKVQCS